MTDDTEQPGGGDPRDAIWKRDEIDSPCIKICVVHPESRLCTGCLRSIDEIGAWSRMSAQARRAIMAELPDRASRITRRRGGRAARLADNLADNLAENLADNLAGKMADKG